VLVLAAKLCLLLCWRMARRKRRRHLKKAREKEERIWHLAGSVKFWREETGGDPNPQAKSKGIRREHHPSPWASARKKEGFVFFLAGRPR